MHSVSEAVMPYILTISSGKGGVGKSVLAVNLAKAMSLLGIKVLIWDANRNFPNCHLMYGAEPPFRLSDVFNGTVNVSSALFELSDNLHLLADYPCSGLETTFSSIEFNDILRDILFDTSFELIIIDTPAGVTEIGLSAAMVSDAIDVVITDEPTSMLDGYGLIKIMLDYIEQTRFNLLINNIIDFEDGEEISRKLNLATDKFLGFEVNLGGIIPYSRIVRQSIVRQELFIDSDPEAEVSKSVMDYAEKIVLALNKKSSERLLNLEKII